MFGFDCGYYPPYGADVDELSRQMSILPVDMAKTGVSWEGLFWSCYSHLLENMFQSDSNLVVECS